MDSFIRWAGSKRQLVKKLRAFRPKHFGRYIEPFAGSACLFFHMEPEEAVLGDLNYELVSTMQAVQRDVHLVLECLHRLRKGKTNYYTIRAKDPTALSEAEIAARFIYLNRYCFNGLYRTNKTGHFNVPYGPPKSQRGIDENQIIKASNILQRAFLVHGDFESTLVYAAAGDFVYLDPPYIIQSRRIFAEYLPGTFNREDLGRLELALETLHDRGVFFLITYGDSHEARQMLGHWNPCRIRTRRNIAGFAGNRRGAYELIATNISKGQKYAD